MGDRSLTVRVLIAGFIIDRACEAIESLGTRGVGAREGERVAAGLGPLATGISALTASACCGAICLRIRGGGAGGAAFKAGPAAGSRTATLPIATAEMKLEKAKADRSARMGAHERARALPPKLKGLAKVVERPEGCQCLCHQR